MKRFLVLCAALFTAIACNDSTGPGAVASIAVNFPTAPIPVGSTAQLNPQALDKNGNPVQAECVYTFTSSDESVATVSSSGLITGVSEGTATITVETFGKTASSVITVGSGAGPVSAITLVPQSVTIAQGQSGQVYAILTDANGDNIPVANLSVSAPGGSGVSQQTNAPVTVQWASNNTAVATVSGTGVITGLTEGTAIITAVAGGKTATANISVVPSTNAVANIRIVPSAITVGIGSEAQLNAILTDANGVVLSNRTMTWTTSNAAIATVNPATGLVKGVSAGNATITVTSEGKTASITVSVSSTGQGSIAFNQDTISVPVGGTAHASVVVSDADGNPVASPTVSFMVLNTSVATVSATGTSATVTGVANGQTRLRAVANGLTAEVPIIVSSVTVSSVSISPANPQVAVGQTLQMTATARDAGGNPIPGKAATWTSSNEAVATVTPNGGLVRGHAVGNATVTGTIDGVSNTVTVNVTPAQPAAIQINPPGPISLGVGQHVNLEVTVRDGAGNVINGLNLGFNSRNEAVASVTDEDLLFPDGRVTAGSVPNQSTYIIVTAIAGGVTKRDSVRIDVTLLPPAQIQIPAPSVCVPLGRTVQLVGTVLDAANNVLTGQPISWAVSNPSVGSITAGGLLTGLTSGVTNVIASVGGVTQTVAVTVCPATVERVTLTPATASIPVNGTVQLVATTYDGLDNVLNGRTVTYTTSDASVATVSNTGLVTGLKVGNVTITATSEGKTATASIAVTNAPVDQVVVTPSVLSMTLTGGTRQLEVKTFDSFGNELTGRPVTYSSSNTGVASVSSTGVVTAHAIGDAVITVTSEGRSATVQVSVVNAPVASVQLIGPSLILKLLWGTSSETYTVVTRDADGNILTGRSCTWTSSNPNVFDVNLGVVTALGLGTARLTVTCEGKSDSKDIGVISVLSF
jgi:uncharacterized protein YjdB